jgi:zinc protease
VIDQLRAPRAHRIRLLAVAMIAATLAAVACSSATQGSGGTQTSARTESFTVAGIPVVLRPTPANQVIAVRLYLKGGAANIPADKAGIEYLMALSSGRGTAKYTRDQFAARAAATGTAFSAETNPDFAAFSLQALREHWDAAWDLFSEAVRRPTFPDAEVGIVRGQIVNSLRGRMDNPDAYLAVFANNVMFAGHPYSVDPLGTPETVAALTAADLRAWHAQRMTRENLLIIVVGNVSRADLTAKITAAFGDLPATGGTAKAPAQLGTTPKRLEVSQRQLPTNYVRGEFIAPAPSHPDYAPMRVAMDLLSSRLFEEIRTKRNLTYAVQAGLSQRQVNYGLLYVTAVTPDTTIKVMLSEIDRMKTQPISADQLAQSVNVFLTTYWLSQETNMGQATTLGTFAVAGGGWQNADAFAQRVRAVRPADIQRVMQSYARNITWVAIGNPAVISRELFTSY